MKGELRWCSTHVQQQAAGTSPSRRVCWQQEQQQPVLPGATLVCAKYCVFLRRLLTRLPCLSPSIDTPPPLPRHTPTTTTTPGVFNWVVSAINAKLDMGKKGSGRFIAILDIYGFEQFQVNR